MKCEICKTPINDSGRGGWQRRYCSQKCYSRARYLRRRALIESRPGFIEVSCKACNSSFERSTSRGGTKLYCSTKCKAIGSAAAKWGKSPSEFFALIKSSDTCAICRTHVSVLRPPLLVIDHDHSCCSGYRSCGSCIRARICNSCNTALGYMQDDPERLRRAADYIEHHRRQKDVTT